MSLPKAQEAALSLHPYLDGKLQDDLDSAKTVGGRGVINYKGKEFEREFANNLGGQFVLKALNDKKQAINDGVGPQADQSQVAGNRSQTPGKALA